MTQRSTSEERPTRRPELADPKMATRASRQRDCITHSTRCRTCSSRVSSSGGGISACASACSAASSAGGAATWHGGKTTPAPCVAKVYGPIPGVVKVSARAVERCCVRYVRNASASLDIFLTWLPLRNLFLYPYDDTSVTTPRSHFRTCWFSAPCDAPPLPCCVFPSPVAYI